MVWYVVGYRTCRFFSSAVSLAALGSTKVPCSALRRASRSAMSWASTRPSKKGLGLGLGLDSSERCAYKQGYRCYTGFIGIAGVTGEQEL